VGYRGKVEEQQRASAMREAGRTLKDIAQTLGVSKSSVSLWVRDIDVEIRRVRPTRRRANSLHDAKVAEIESCNRLGVERIGVLEDKEFLVTGLALYAGEGAKRDGEVIFANTDTRMVAVFCAWLRHFFAIDESRLRVRVYLHNGLDLDAAQQYWSRITGVPREQFNAPYRAKADPTIRANKHEYGCVYVRYCCSRTHRQIMGLMRALLSLDAIPG
jgi:hypothetical protein